MQQNHNRIKLNRYTTGILVLLIVAAVAFILLRQNNTEASTPTKPAATTAKSQFSFTGAPGWRKGPSNKTSMAVFNADHTCFISAEYKTGSVDAAAEVEKIKDKLADSGYTVTPGATQTIALQSNSGQHQYELYQYSVTGSGGAGTVKGGQEFGYSQLSSGYVKAEGYCDTAEQLPTTTPALNAIKFDSTI
jgi:hypothetical protein